MKTKISFLVLSVILGNILSCNGEEGRPYMKSDRAANDSVNTVLLTDYLRAHFDDIHDVSMGFHHLDHTLNGIIEINMTWLKGRMIDWRVFRNETGSEEFASALTAKIQTWEIPGLEGPFIITLPFRIKIVGSDDPAFSQKGILTGEITDKNGTPVNHAQLRLISATKRVDTLHNWFSNRDGVFVMTLIPVGIWNLECSAPGFELYIINGLHFKPGEHLRQKISLRALK